MSLKTGGVSLKLQRLSLLAVTCLTVSLLSSYSGVLVSGCTYDVRSKIEGVPRRNFNFQLASPSIDFYEIIAPCDSTDGNSGVCASADIDAISDDGSLVFDGTYASENPTSISNYVQALIMLVAIGIFFTVFTTCVFCCGCCVKICCVVRDNKFKAEYGPEAYYAYSKNSVVFTYFCLVLFIFTMFVLLLMGIVRGNAIIRSTLLSTVDAPDGSAALVKGLPDPFLEVAVGFLGGTLVAAAVDLKDTVDATIDLNGVHESFNCVRDITSVVNVETFDFFVQKIDELETAVQTGLNLPSTVLTGLQADVDQVITSVDQTIDIIDSYSTALQNIDLPAVVSALDDTSISLKVNLRGNLVLLQADLDKYVLLSTTLGAADNSANVLLTQTFQKSFATQFLADATALDDLVTGLPDGSVLLQRVDAVKAAMSDVSTSLSNLLLTLVDLQNAIDNIPPTSAAQAALSNLNNEVSNFDLAQTRDTLLSATTAIPDFSPLLLKFAEILDTSENIPCIVAVTDIPRRIDQDLVEIPPDTLEQISGNLSGLDEQLQNTLDGIANASNGIRDLVDELSINETVAELNQRINDVFGSIDLKIGDVSTQIDALTAPLNQLDSSLAALDISSFSTQITDLQQSLDAAVNSFDLSQDDRNKISAVDSTSLATVSGQLVSLAQEFDALPVQSSYSCKVATGTECYNGAIIIPSPCTGADECSYPFERLLVEEGLLQASKSSFDNDVLPIVSSLNNAVADVISQIDAVDFGTVQASNELLTVDEQLNDLQPSLDQVKSDLQTVVDDLNTLVRITGNQDSADLQVFEDAKADIAASRDAVIVAFDAIDIALDYEQATFDYLTIDIDTLLTKLSRSNLQAKLDTSVEDLINFVLDVLIEHSEAFQLRFDEDVSFLDSLKNNRADINKLARALDVIRDKPNIEKEGSYFYFYEVYLASIGEENPRTKSFEKQQAEQFKHPLVQGHVENGEVVSYPNDAICLTDGCIKNTIVFYDSSSGSDVSGGTVDSSLNRESAMNLPYIFGFLVVLVALLVFCFPCVCGNTLAICSLGIAIFIFLVIGGVLFPLVVFTGDSCEAAEPLGAKAIQVSQDSWCSDLDGTKSAEGFCSISANIPGLIKSDIDIDGAAMFKSMFIGCDAGQTTANGNGQTVESVDAFYSVIGQKTADGLGSVLQDFVTTDFQSITGLKLRSKLQASFLRIRPNLAGNVIDFASSLSENLGCKRVSDAYLDIKDPICCGAVSALYYGTAMWYTMAFALLCCGCPAGCLAPSRLRDVKKSRNDVVVFVRERMDQIEGSKVGQKIFGQKSIPQAATFDGSQPHNSVGRFYMEGGNKQTDGNVQLAEEVQESKPFSFGEAGPSELSMTGPNEPKKVNIEMHL